MSSVEKRLGRMLTPEGQRRRDELPAFLRRTLTAFVLATVEHRGGTEVRAEHFGIVEEAFGYFPRPLARFPFVSNSGPLNFYLANHAGAKGGFDRAPLEEPPPLRGRYPEFLIQNLPPPQLTFFYPPHLHLFNEGYSLGWRWIRNHPLDFARLTARKLAIFWAGSALGLTGYNVPLGLSGIRRSVDLVAPDGAMIWQIVLLIIAAIGVARTWRNAALRPWLLFLASRIAATILFFGYARTGATAIPVVALLLALAVNHWTVPRMRLGAAVLLLAVMVEAARTITQPVVTLDGQMVGTVDPFPPDLHRDQQLAVIARR